MPTEKILLNKIVQECPIWQKKKVESIKQTIQTAGIESIPPLSCIEENGKYLIRDGRHRFEALKELGCTSAWVEY